ncbi:hypothetical protein BGX27_007541 [Mortierella sp. AM989]|nr:hypothetical protein BGX27_007541 [Mortierella sp. AM989]
MKRRRHEHDGPNPTDKLRHFIKVFRDPPDADAIIQRMLEESRTAALIVPRVAGSVSSIDNSCDEEDDSDRDSVGTLKASSATSIDFNSCQIQHRGLQFESNGTNQKNILIATQFLVEKYQQIKAHCEFHENYNPSSIRIEKEFVFFSQELIKREPSLAFVTTVTLRQLFNHMIEEYRSLQRFLDTTKKGGGQDIEWKETRLSDLTCELDNLNDQLERQSRKMNKLKQKKLSQAISINSVLTSSTPSASQEPGVVPLTPENLRRLGQLRLSHIKKTDKKKKGEVEAVDQQSNGGYSRQSEVIVPSPYLSTIICRSDVDDSATTERNCPRVDTPAANEIEEALNGNEGRSGYVVDDRLSVSGDYIVRPVEENEDVWSVGETRETRSVEATEEAWSDNEIEKVQRVVIVNRVLHDIDTEGTRSAGETKEALRDGITDEEGKYDIQANAVQSDFEEPLLTSNTGEAQSDDITKATQSNITEKAMLDRDAGQESTAGPIEITSAHIPLKAVPVSGFETDQLYRIVFEMSQKLGEVSRQITKVSLDNERLNNKLSVQGAMLKSLMGNTSKQDGAKQTQVVMLPLESSKRDKVEEEIQSSTLKNVNKFASQL